MRQRARNKRARNNEWLPYTIACFILHCYFCAYGRMDISPVSWQKACVGREAIYYSVYSRKRAWVGKPFIIPCIVENVRG
jgi:hypothetical protein